jgi:SulP family sulfate permease
LADISEAALSAIVFPIGAGLIDLAGMRRVFDQRRSEFWVALITTLTVVVVGVEEGILLAIALSLIEHTRHGYRPKNAVLVPGASGGRQPEPVATAAQAAPGLVIYRFSHSLYYANCQQLSDEISFLADTKEPPVRWLCIDASAIDDVDYSAAETYGRFTQS